MVSVRAYTPKMEKAWVRAYNRISLSRKDILFLLQNKPADLLYRDQLVLIDEQDQIIGFCDTAADKNILTVVHFGILPDHFPTASTAIDAIIHRFSSSDFERLIIMSGDTRHTNLFREKGFTVRRNIVRFFCNAPRSLLSDTKTDNLFCDHVYAECPANKWKQVRSSLTIIESDLMYPVTYQELILEKAGR